MSDVDITVERQGGIATIRLSRPDARNALTPEAFARLDQTFAEVSANADDRVVVLTGDGEAFCAGADLTGSAESIERLAEGPVSRGQFTREAVAAARSLHRIPKPTIAAVNGVAAGAGCNLALGCDVAFAAESARFSQIFVNRGLVVDYGGTWLLPRLVGLQRAKDIAFRGDILSAAEALEFGLVLEVVPDHALAKRVAEYAAMLAAKPPIALSLIKSGLNRSSTWAFEEALEFEAEAQAQCLGSADFREALKAFFTKQSGTYSGV